MEKLTKKQIEQGLTKLMEWSPQEAEKMRINKDEIISLLMEEKEPEADSPLLKLKFSEIIEPEIAEGEITPCEEEMAVVSVEVFFFILSIFGLKAARSKLITKAVRNKIKKLPAAVIDRFKKHIRDFADAKSAKDKAECVFTLLKDIYKMGIFGAIINVIKNQWGFWDWLKVGVKFAAQILIWVGTDGFAFIAKAVLTIMDAVDLIKACIKCKKVCYGEGC